MAVTIKGFGSDWSVPSPARAALDALYTTKAEGLGATDVTNSALLAGGRRVALGGDSITFGAGATNVALDAYRAYLAKILGTARADIINHGVPGEPASGLLARMPAILAENPSVFVMMIGTNASTSLGKYKQDVTAILDLARGARVPVVINTVPATGSDRTDAAAHRERTNAYNLFLRHIAAQRGIPVADTFTATVDPATGYLRASYNTDGTHPTPAGHLAIAKAVAPVVSPLLPSYASPVTAPGAPGLVTNPLMSGGGETTRPTDWDFAQPPTTGMTYTIGTVAPEPGDGLRAGQWLRMTADATAITGTGVLSYRHRLTPIPAPGDQILVLANIKTSPGSEDRVSLQWVDGGTIISIAAEAFGVPNPGEIKRVYTIPAGGVADPRLRFNVSSPAGTVHTGYLGAVQVYNLTQLGLTELA